MLEKFDWLTSSILRWGIKAGNAETMKLADEQYNIPEVALNSS